MEGHREEDQDDDDPQPEIDTSDPTDRSRHKKERDNRRHHCRRADDRATSCRHGLDRRRDNETTAASIETAVTQVRSPFTS